MRAGPRGRLLPRILLVVALGAVAWQSLVPNDDVVVSTPFDKLNHLVAYMVLGLLAGLSAPDGTARRCLIAFAGLVAFGLLVEIAQGLSGYRSAELLDLLADAAGAALGLLAVAFSQRRLTRHRARGSAAPQ